MFEEIVSFTYLIYFLLTKGEIHSHSMGAKDITEKTLESYSDVFADIINVLMFQGARIIREEELEERAPGSAYKADGKIHETERDPVVTLVLYFGYDRRWTYSSELRNRLQIPEGFKTYVSDYQINLFEIAYLNDKQLDMFESDFRIVADYFVQMRKNGEYQPEPRQIRHVRETLHMLSVLTGDSRFEDVNNEGQEGVRTMCEVLDRIEKRGEQRGLEQGMKQGITQGIKQMILRMQKNGYSIEQIARVAEMSERSIKKMIG